MKGIVDIELRFVPSVQFANDTDGNSNRRVVKRLQWRRQYRTDEGDLVWESWDNVPLRDPKELL